MAATNFIKMVNTIQYLHQNLISHRDVKPENFLFKTKENDSEIKLIDFGLSKKFGNCPFS